MFDNNRYYHENHSHFLFQLLRILKVAPPKSAATSIRWWKGMFGQFIRVLRGCSLPPARKMLNPKVTQILTFLKRTYQGPSASCPFAGRDSRGPRQHRTDRRDAAQSHTRVPSPTRVPSCARFVQDGAPARSDVLMCPDMRTPPAGRKPLRGALSRQIGGPLGGRQVPRLTKASGRQARQRRQVDLLRQIGTSG